MQPVRLLIIDDQPVVLVGLRVVFQQEPSIKLVGEARDARTAVAQTLRLQPDVVLLDPAMQDMHGIEALVEIRDRRPETRVVLFSGLHSAEWVRKFFHLGVAGFVLKSQELTDLAGIIRSVHEGRTYVSPRLVDAAAAEFRWSDPHRDRPAP